MYASLLTYKKCLNDGNGENHNNNRKLFTLISLYYRMFQRHAHTQTYTHTLIMLSNLNVILPALIPN